ncbi:MAG TPA: carbamoyltransferase HypF, partial [Nitrospirota bacterium]
MATRARLTVTGIVQGVGFRPHVYRLAGLAGLKGYVLNNARGVVIEVEGELALGFADILRDDPPPLSTINTFEVETLPIYGYNAFEIRLSEDAEGEFALVSPDIATCPDCINEVRDAKDRRFGYPFTNCTNCGPRYSIVKGVPYDRAKTTMAAFNMCPVCAREYHDPADRRFHAQPVACPACGPKLEFVGPDGMRGESFSGDALAKAVEALMSGKIVAIKGLGGFHLACKAGNAGAVSTLRTRKRKCNKPFALMAPDVDTVRRYCEVSPHEESLLTGRVRPIVILNIRPGAEGMLPPDVAPGVSTLGFMLPYTPLHHLLFDCSGGRLDTLVMTSGNIAEEPIVTDNGEALKKLSGMADSFLLHDRDVYMRVDDSIARVVSGIPRVIRRARGYAPETIDLGREMPEVLACGGELKNTLT